MCARPRIKVCCIASTEEARLAMAHGASAIGLVSSMPSGPGVIPEPLIASIAAAAPPAVATFLLTSSLDVEDIIGQQRRCGVNTIQLCDRLSAGAVLELRDALPGISIVQVVHVVDGASVDEAHLAAQTANGLLLDSGRPDAAVKELGGTGRTHDWALSRQIRDCVDVPVFLAGGLGPDNVAAAVEVVRPFGVDVCSGLRSDGRLDEHKLAAFVRALDPLG